MVLKKNKEKAWERSRNRLRRTTETRGLPKQTFLIVCEGEKTEPNYFNAFEVKSAKVTTAGTGCNTVSLVKKAQIIVNTYLKENIEFDQVWCVFDRDDFGNTFNDAIFKAKRIGYKVAYSNEAFELWYLLHFIYIDSSLSRDGYIKKLNEHLDIEYKKNSTEMYRILFPNQCKAIKRAKKLLSNCNGTNPKDENPSTTVHLLVEELKKYI